MHFATGYSFNSNDLFYNLPIKKLKITTDECKRYFKTANKRLVAIRIFYYTLKLILLDIINNNVTFQFPTQRKCYLQMKRTCGEDFKNARRNGKWLDVDYMASNFTGYQIEFLYYASERDIHKPVYISNNLKNLITKYTNEGKQYY